jgi:hypothetical protein
MPDPIDEAIRASDQAEAVQVAQRQQQALTDAQDEAGGRAIGHFMGGPRITNFVEFLLILLVMFGVAIAALVWQTFFGDDEPGVGQVPTEQHHHDDGTETPTFNPGG